MSDEIEKIPEEEWEDCPYCDNMGYTVETGTKAKRGRNGEPIPVPVPKKN